MPGLDLPSPSLPWSSNAKVTELTAADVRYDIHHYEPAVKTKTRAADNVAWQIKSFQISYGSESNPKIWIYYFGLGPGSDAVPYRVLLKTLVLVYSKIVQKTENHVFFEAKYRMRANCMVLLPLNSVENKTWISVIRRSLSGHLHLFKRRCAPLRIFLASLWHSLYQSGYHSVPSSKTDFCWDFCRSHCLEARSCYRTCPSVEVAYKHPLWTHMYT